MTTLNNTQEQYSSIPEETVELTRKVYPNNSVIKFLVNEFGEGSQARFVKESDIGSARNGSILWFRDYCDKFCTGRIIHVDERTGSILGEDEELVHQKFASK